MKKFIVSALVTCCVACGGWVRQPAVDPMIAYQAAKNAAWQAKVDQYTADAAKKLKEYNDEREAHKYDERCGNALRYLQYIVPGMSDKPELVEELKFCIDNQSQFKVEAAKYCEGGNDRRDRINQFHVDTDAWLEQLNRCREYTASQCKTIVHPDTNCVPVIRYNDGMIYKSQDCDVHPDTQTCKGSAPVYCITEDAQNVGHLSMGSPVVPTKDIINENVCNQLVFVRVIDRDPKVVFGDAGK